MASQEVFRFIDLVEFPTVFYTCVLCYNTSCAFRFLQTLWNGTQTPGYLAKAWNKAVLSLMDMMCYIRD